MVCAALPAIFSRRGVRVLACCSFAHGHHWCLFAACAAPCHSWSSKQLLLLAQCGFLLGISIPSAAPVPARHVRHTCMFRLHAHVGIPCPLHTVAPPKWKSGLVGLVRKRGKSVADCFAGHIHRSRLRGPGDLPLSGNGRPTGPKPCAKERPVDRSQ